MLPVTFAPPVIKVFLKVFKNVIKLRTHVDCMTSQLSDLNLNERLAFKCVSLIQLSLIIFTSIIASTVKVWNWQVWMPLWAWLSKRMGKNNFFFFQLCRVEQEGEKNKKTLCIFVDSEDNVGKIRHWTRKSLFYLGFVFLPFSPGVLGVLWKCYPGFSPLHPEWPGRNVCGGVKFEEDGGTWGSEEEHWSLTGPKLSVRLEHDTWDSAGSCTNKAAAKYSGKIPSTLTRTFFEIPLVTQGGPNTPETPSTFGVPCCFWLLTPGSNSVLCSA